MDRLEIRVPAMTEMAGLMAPVERDIRLGVTPPGFFRNPHYAMSADLRQYGIDAKVFLSCKAPGAPPDHKVEIADSGKRSLRENLAIVEEIFKYDPLQKDAELMRIDLAVDVSNIPVSWFYEAAYVEFKRKNTTFERVKYGEADLETIYCGKRPNCLRIYNKTAEFKKEYRKLCARHIRLHRGAAQLGGEAERQSLPPCQSFQEIFGVEPESTLTRVERQCGGGRVPYRISTCQRLRLHAAAINPFDRLRFKTSPARLLPDPAIVGPERYLAAIGAQHLLAKLGMQRFKRRMDEISGRHGARLMRRYSPFVSPEEMISEGELYERYCASVERQLAA